MHETVDAAEVNKYAVGSDILDFAFEHLALFELGDDLLLLLLELSLDESFVRNDNVLELLVDFHNLEFHSLVDIYIVVADGADVDLRAGQECLDAEDVDDHAAFCAALDIAFDNLVVLEGLVDAVP